MKSNSTLTVDMSHQARRVGEFTLIPYMVENQLLKDCSFMMKVIIVFTNKITSKLEMFSLNQMLLSQCLLLGWKQIGYIQKPNC